MNELVKTLLLSSPSHFADVVKSPTHQFESDVIHDSNTRTVVVLLRCRSCRSEASIKLHENDILRDEHAIRHTVFEMCEAHEHAWSNEGDKSWHSL